MNKAQKQKLQMVSDKTTISFLFSKQELRQAGHYMPVASNKMQNINWLLYNSVLQI